MKQDECMFSKMLRSLSLVFALLLGAANAVSASIDWGGGSTRFFDREGEALDDDTGCAVLIEVS